MPVSLELLHDNHLMVFTYTDPFSIVEMNEMFNNAMPLLDKVTGAVYGIHDGSRLRTLPRNMLSFASRTGKVNLNHPNAGSVCVIAPTMFMHVVVNAISKALPSGKLFVVKTMEEALAKIDQLMADEEKVKA